MSEVEELTGIEINDLANEQEGTISVDIGTVETPEVTEEVSNVPEKFQNEDGTLNTDALLKSYTELEKGRGVEPEVKPEVEPKVETEGFDLQPYYDKFSQGTEITEEDINTISSGMSIDSSLVESYIKLHTESNSNARAEAEADADSRIYATVGGEEAYSQMSAWASTNLSESEMANLNLQLDNPVFAEGGAKLLKALYENANGTEPVVKIEPTADLQLNTQDPDEFYSEQEVREAQKDPKYLAGDPRTHALFDAKLGRFLARKG